MNLTTNWPSWQAFVEMGGYGLYVWGSVWVSFVALAWESWALRLDRQKSLQRAREVEFRGAGRATP